MRRVVLTCSVAMVMAAAPAAAQVQRADSAAVRTDAGSMIAAGVIGSALGTAAGLVAGGALGIGGGDDPGLAGALLGGVVGGSVGAATGVAAASPHISFGQMLGPSFVSILAGIGTGILLGELTDGRHDEWGAVIGFSVGQGTAAGLIGWLLQPR